MNVTPTAATHLAFTTPPPIPITAGQAFTVVASAEAPYGTVDTSFNDSVMITLPTQPARNVTGQATNGVATFPNLTLGATEQGRPIQASGGLTAGSTGSVTVTGGSSNPGSGSNSPGKGSRACRPRRSPASRS